MKPALTTSFFDRMYEDTEDPWGFSDRWYERRKRALLLASLPRPRFHSVFEPGCSTGLLSAELGDRCDALLATDVTDSALRTARANLARLPHARVARMAVPHDWPSGTFDLVVVSEIAYYLDEDGARLLGQAVSASLTDDGVLAVCHWRHPVPDYPLTGDRAQALVRDSSALAVQVRHLEDDFILEVLTRQGVPSVAAAEGLVGD